MKLKIIAVAITLALLMTALSVQAGAALIDIGTATYTGVGTFNLIYDDNPSGPIVWLDYTNPTDNLSKQVAWAGSLNGALTYNFLPGYSMIWGSGWQLPTTVDNDSSANYPPLPSSSQMAYLYYTQLGNPAGSGLGNVGPFTLLLNNYYWSGTEYSASTGLAWYFLFRYGYQDYGYENNTNQVFGLADRPGQLESATVPEPSTMLLLGLGLAGLVGLRNRRRGC